MVSEEIQNQDIPPQFSRSESKVQDEKIEQEQFSEKKESVKMVKHQPSRRTNSSSKKTSSSKKNKNRIRK